MRIADAKSWNKTNALRWAAWAMSLAPCIGATIALWVMAGGHPFALLVGGTIFVCLTAVPALIAWRFNLLGGILIIAWGAFHIYRACFAPLSGGELRIFEVFANIPFWGVFSTSGVMYVIVWCRDRGKTRHVLGGPSSGLLWAGRLISSTTALIYFLFGVIFLYAFMAVGDFHPSMLLPLIPPLLATVAWSRHLVGGISVVLFSFTLFWVGRSPYGFVGSSLGFSVGILFSASGILHLIVWRQEKKQAVN